MASSSLNRNKNKLVENESLGGGVWRIKLQDADNLNAMSNAMAEQFAEVVSELRREKDLRVVIVTGAGRAFCAGGHLEMLSEKTQALSQENTRAMQLFYNQFLSIRQIEVPVIAAVNGPAVGGGACLAFACDLRVASQKAKFGFNFVKLGLHPGMGATYLLPRLIGLAKASELLFGAETISAKEALVLGLVNSVCEHRQLNFTVNALAKKIASNAPVAMRQMTMSLRNSLESTFEQSLLREAKCQGLGYVGREFKEGLAAAKGKREPKF